MAPLPATIATAVDQISMFRLLKSLGHEWRSPKVSILTLCSDEIH